MLACELHFRAVRLRPPPHDSSFGNSRIDGPGRCPYALSAISCRRPRPASTTILFGCTLVIPMHRDRVLQHLLYHSFSQLGWTNPVFLDALIGTIGITRFRGEIRHEGCARAICGGLRVRDHTGDRISKFPFKPCDARFQGSRNGGETIDQTKNEMRPRFCPRRFWSSSTPRTGRAPGSTPSSPSSPSP